MFVFKMSIHAGDGSETNKHGYESFTGVACVFVFTISGVVNVNMANRCLVLGDVPRYKL